ncbi:MAG: Rne/Rng family ribonuclease [Chitinophagales bacterium]|nr:Rne/Rng family ribonuclease [Chitinophagales bacterium]
MNRELIIDAGQNGVDIALLEDKTLVELHQENLNQNVVIGDIFLSKVGKVLPGLNAAFIDVGQSKNGFLHYSDLGPQIRSVQKSARLAMEGTQPDNLNDFKLEPETLKTGKMAQTINKKFPLLVQITKEPISTKGHRLSCDLSLAGRYLVLIPFTNVVSISKKINSQEERKRLLRLTESIKPKNFGVILRTLAEGKSVQELHEDMVHLTDKWKELTRELKDAAAPKKVLSEMSKTSTLLRDMLNASFNRVLVNSKETYNEVRNYIARIAPDKESIVQLYNGRIPIFDQYDITKQVKSSFGKTVNMPSGAYLIIEHTEALHVVDVNSGHQTANDKNQEENAMKVNLEAAQEIARQMRLRDIGGIIIIDFIDVRSPENKRLISKTMTDSMQADKARHTVLPLSRFGLMQITRQRVKPEITISTDDDCPSCGGTGKIGPSIILLDEIIKNLDHLISKNHQKKITLFVHPYLEAYVKSGYPSMRMKWWWQYKQWVNVDSDETVSINEYHFYDKNGDEILMN